MNKVIDLNYCKNLRKSVLSDAGNNNSINTQREIYSVPMDLIMDLHTCLGWLVILLKKEDRSEKLDALNFTLTRMTDIAIFLDIDLITEVQEVQVTAPEIILNALFNNVSQLNYKKEVSRNKLLNRIVPLFAELVYSLGFSLEELKETYSKQMAEVEQGTWKN